MKKSKKRRDNHMPVPASPQPEVIPAEIIPTEVIAVIAAAVAAITDGLGTITAIRKQKTGTGMGRPVWSMAGVLENTRPF